MRKIPIYSRNQVTQYVLFLVGRVGSTYLTSVLNSHPNIMALGEELQDLEEAGAEAQLKWARDFLNSPILSRNAAHGFNVKLVHLRDPVSFARLLRDQHCKVFHLQRCNRVKAVVSRLNGRRLYKKTGMWGLFDETSRPSSFQIDPEEFDELLENRERADLELEEYIESLELPKQRLFYEDLLRDESAFLNRVFEFLNVGPITIKGSTFKITSDDLREVIINFDEVKARYVGTPYEPMFDEVIVA